MTRGRRHPPRRCCEPRSIYGEQTRLGSVRAAQSLTDPNDAAATAFALDPLPRFFTLAVSMASDPVFIAYTAKRAKSGKRPVWTRISQAYPHDSGAGLTLCSTPCRSMDV